MDDRRAEDPLEGASAAMADGEPGRAAEILQAALRTAPDNRAWLEALARALRAMGRRKESFAVYNRLIALGDVSAETWNAIGEALVSAREYAQAIGFFRESLSVADNAPARHNLGQALFKMGDLDEAVSHLEPVARATGEAVSWTALATAIPGAPGTSEDGILAIRRDFAAWLAESPLASRATPPRLRTRAPGESIRVGYVSSWFTGANYMKPVWALINNHDRSRFEVHLLSDSPPDAELVGYEPQPGDTLHATGSLDNTGLAGLIAAIGIDVLIDLNAYSTPPRLGLFVTPPAPVTAAWFNMYATSGLPGFHYIIGDDEVAKPGEDDAYSERVLRLPMSYLTFITAPPHAAGRRSALHRERPHYVRQPDHPVQDDGRRYRRVVGNAERRALFAPVPGQPRHGPGREPKLAGGAFRRAWRRRGPGHACRRCAALRIPAEL